MLNRVRGDVSLTLDGVERRLRLTFGALAEIETALGVATLDELGARLARMSANDIRLVLAALMRGAGYDSAAERVNAARVNLKEAASAISLAFREATQ